MLAPAAMAQTAVIFERTKIRIDPVAPVAEAPAKDGETAPQPMPREPVSYDIEARGEEALQLEYIHTLNTLSDSTGVAIVFNPPGVVALPRMQVFTPVDVLFVAEDGTILQIYPDATLGTLDQDVYVKDPVRAFIFLKAGEVAAKNIRPRDVVAGTMFTPAPPVLE
jgi:uncharacterized membrane protein (UPF0127 family)